MSTDNDDIPAFMRGNLSMPPVSAEVEARSRKNSTIVLQRLISVGQVRIAEGMGLNESTITRFKDNDVEKVCRILALLGLKIVPSEWQVMDKDAVAALLTLSQKVTIEQLVSLEA